jgi:hypothetical protein
MSIHAPSNGTPAEGKRWRRDRLNGEVERVVALMKRGAVLRRTNRANSTRWALSIGRSVADEIAQVVITRGDVAGVGDSLFGAELSQTWRWVEPTA